MRRDREADVKPRGRAREGAQRYILLVRRAPRRALKHFVREPDQPLEIALPEFLGGGVLAGLELADPVADRP